MIRTEEDEEEEEEEAEKVEEEDDDDEEDLFQFVIRRGLNFPTVLEVGDVFGKI